MFQRLFGRARSANREITDALYGAIVAAARQEPLYSRVERAGHAAWPFRDAVAAHVPVPAPPARRGGRAARAGAGADRRRSSPTSTIRCASSASAIVGVPKRMKKLAACSTAAPRPMTTALERGRRGSARRRAGAQRAPGRRATGRRPRLLAAYVVRGAARRCEAQPTRRHLRGTHHLSGMHPSNGVADEAGRTCRQAPFPSTSTSPACRKRACRS